MAQIQTDSKNLKNYLSWNAERTYFYHSNICFLFLSLHACDVWESNWSPICSCQCCMKGRWNVRTRERRGRHARSASLIHETLNLLPAMPTRTTLKVPITIFTPESIEDRRPKSRQVNTDAQATQIIRTLLSCINQRHKNNEQDICGVCVCVCVCVCTHIY
jgi:hypothetical protein